MKIAVVAASAIPSSRANSIQVMKVSQALLQNGHEPRLYVPGNRKTPWNELKTRYGLLLEFPIQWIPAWKPLRYLDFTLLTLLNARFHGADLIYTRMPQVALTAVRCGIPSILELHEVPSGRYGLKFVQSFLHARQKKMLVFITRSLQTLVEDQLGEKLVENTAVVAPDGVDLERYSGHPGPAEARARLGLPEQFTALYSGSFYQGRGMQLLFDLAGQLPEVQFLWVGGCPDEVEGWRSKLSAAGIQNVILTGFVDNNKIALYQAAADLLMMPYSRKIAGSSGGNISEVTSPMKLFEYLASGRPILSADLPVLHEVLNSSNTVFCAPDDLAAWRSTIQALIKNPERRAQLASRAKTDAVEYSWQNRMAKVIQQWSKDA